MSELIPSRQAARVREALTGFLTTTFALSDLDAQRGLDRFLTDPDAGIFRGPYARVRVPFQAAAEGWRDDLGWYEGHTPYGHQAAAFERLSSANLGRPLRSAPDGPVKDAPLPTLVVTGTGSGKTEAFLYPIIDHVLREQAAGDAGVKVLILYPMNALANDQARRIAGLITGHEALRGIRAGLYTGEQGSAERTRVTAEGLITHRQTIQDEPPDILLTNYKMLDQLLLRTADQPVIGALAQSLQYLVLDEFHTYDGAQGTDVAMLLRRLGLALRRLRPAVRPLAEVDAAYPLLDVTPVATSATLGDDGDPAGMLAFAQTVFGREFTPDAVVTETRQSIRRWVQTTLAVGTPCGGAPRRVGAAVAHEIATLPIAADAEASAVATAVLRCLFDGRAPVVIDGAELPSEPGNDVDWDAVADGDLLASVAVHPLVQELARAAEKATSLDDLADAMLGQTGLGAGETFESRRRTRRVFLERVLAMLSHVRARVGRVALSVDLHLWVRELSRIDRAAATAVSFSWSDDGPAGGVVGDDVPVFPAVYCRHCGRSGWGVELSPVGADLAHETEAIRRHHAARDSRSRFRALLHAPDEAEVADRVAGLAWFDVAGRRVAQAPPDDDAAHEQALPVLALTGDDVDDRSRDDECPACGRRDGIRFLGSAMATMLSVMITSLFGDAALDRTEKKALVFTDSVQDAAHRAGFVQARAHVFALRNAIRHAVGGDAVSLDELVDRMMAQAATADDRYRLLAPDLVDRQEFAPYWHDEKVPAKVRARVKARLQFDVAMEFGLLSRVGRTLELTGSLAAGVDITDEKAETIGRRVLDDHDPDGLLEGLRPAQASVADVVRWVRGVLERIRERGGVEHRWFERYIDEDGRRWRVWGGRPRGVGMPAFPPGREAPAFPRVGGKAPAGDDAHRTHLDVVTSAVGWYATWARRVLHVPAAEGAQLTRMLLAALAGGEVLRSRPAAGGTATAYMVPMAGIVVEPVSDDDLAAAATLLECDVCHNPVTGTRQATAALVDGPCMSARCPGTLRRMKPSEADVSNYYRDLYDAGRMRRVVAREHTSLLEGSVRLDYEDGFKASGDDPSAPNVLVATPTLEMGIDIGDLSTVMLAGIPRRVSSYLQRVGRAGRLTGNALSLAAVTGRGDQLPRMGDPLSVINGAVTPPATFLNAREILQRQFIASVLDRQSAARAAEPHGAAAALGSTEAGTVLGDVIADAEAHSAEYIDAFLAALPRLSSDAADMIRAFPRPTDGPESSPLARLCHDAVQRWNRQVDTVKYRRKEIEDALDDLQAAADRDIEPDAKTALAAAKVTLRLLGHQLHDLLGGHWIAALERFGILPNYTLLDDSVTLDAAVSWVDPDTGGWEDETYTYARGAAAAITELAPGAYFYAQGMEIPVDAVDLGPDGQNVRDWAYCPTCGHAAAVDLAHPVGACPRCGSGGLADIAQRFRVVELETVSAMARRDEAAIGDRADDRRRVRFTVQVAADLDPAGIARQWFDETTRFAVTYARDLTIRWLNLGRAGVGGETRTVAGFEAAAPMFRVCDTCGQLDSQTGANSRRDHRSWCPRRLETVEHTIAVALSRTLTTQGVFLRLPPSVTLGDLLAVPSLSAAILRGLREVMGGDPDHLRALATVQPTPGGTDSAPALLIHDAVPGGTGYLAELADPDRMYELLATAWRIVRDCRCRDEDRAACHRCLLPYAGPDTSRVSRAAAQGALEKILRIDDSHPEPRPFACSDVDPGIVVDESVIEQLFRQRFTERAQALGATVKQTSSDTGSVVQVVFTGDRRIWTLTPQVQIGGTKPDFVLDQHGGGAGSIAIYTDGRQFHASPAHNRLADDAVKRASLRAQGYRVLSVVWADLVDDAPGVDEWLDEAWAGKVAAPYQVPLSRLGKLREDPVTVLMAWMQQPAAEACDRDAIAQALPMMMAAPDVKEPIEVAGRPLAVAAASVLIDGAGNGDGDARAWFVHRGAVISAASLHEDGRTNAVFVIDDRAAALSHPDFADAWRLWLHWANIAGWRDDMSGVEVLALSQAMAAARSASVGPVDFVPVEAALPAEWSGIDRYASPQERAMLLRLASLGIARPTVGDEIAEGIPVSFSWPDVQIAVAWDVAPAEREAIATAGWTLVEPEASAIARALTTTGRN